MQTLARFSFVLGVACVLGILTSYAQGWLPHQIGSLANSSGPWALTAFALALLARDRLGAALFGLVVLLGLLAGYCGASEWRGIAISSALVLFWSAAAVLAGPLVGLGAYWLRTGRGGLAAVGAGGMAGVLLGEGIYGLAYVRDTTYGPYWAAEIVVGAGLLLGAAMVRLERPLAVAEGCGLAALTALAFVVVYHANLISVLP